MKAFNYYACVLNLVEDDWTEFAKADRVKLTNHACSYVIGYVIGVNTESECAYVKEQGRSRRHKVAIPLSMINLCVLEQIIRAMKKVYEEVIAEDDMFEDPSDFLPNYEPCI